MADEDKYFGPETFKKYVRIFRSYGAAGISDESVIASTLAKYTEEIDQARGIRYVTRTVREMEIIDTNSGTNPPIS